MKVLNALAEDWKKVDETEAAKYATLAKEDKSRYERQMKELTTLGYFIQEDGSKSVNKRVKVGAKRGKTLDARPAATKRVK